MLGARPWGSSPLTGGRRQDKVDIEAVEQENDRELDHLADRVALLKNVTHGINKETNDQHKLLDGMDGSFGSVGGLMGAVATKFGVVLDDKANKRMIYGLVAAAALLFLVWYLMRR
ncbi:Bet1-like SNARE 1-2 [Tetrabaena socialis]|uniref:Bet1-like SNARE 1-2 n=1 Tax=Tetrabaena socialis TaxID=47790 RepID=A0A2J7ZVI8_9CHLO|nr:Bet1-like SNARE 1-2 [Tetrabaena socialis]|eukprot:PNH04293.1 Bet1-like SNARE 1-2 [Tetrabaena socialis]